MAQQSAVSMWLVRARRGTRKRCAALFLVGICAALTVFTMPFVTTPLAEANLEEMAAPLAAILPPANASLGGIQSADRNDATAESTPYLPSPPPLPPQNIVPEVQKEPEVDTTVDANAIAATSEKTKTARPTTTPTAKVPPTTNSSATSVPVSEKAPAAGNPANATRRQQAGLNVTAVDSSTTTTTTTTTTVASGAVVPMTAPQPADAPAVLRVPLDSASLARLPTVYVITPTFPRVEQIPELTRLGQTLMHVPKLHWIVADDAPRKSTDVEALLRRTGLSYTYILGAMPEAYRKKKGSKPKGVANRLAGLQWIRDHADNNGVMFLADDDNSYDIRLFEEMRYTKKVSMWPVGLVTHLGVSTPVVRNGRVVDFYDGWISSRKFPVDMAGFAVNVGFLKSRPNATMPFKAGYEEDGFLRSLNITLTEIEPKANNCTKIYVWHTKTVTNKPPQKLSDKDRKKFNSTNLFSIPNIL